eukprot:432425-Amphidinium_carterae.1
MVKQLVASVHSEAVAEESNKMLHGGEDGMWGAPVWRTSDVLTDASVRALLQQKGPVTSERTQQL